MSGGAAAYLFFAAFRSGASKILAVFLSIRETKTSWAFDRNVAILRIGS
jgi:hypothetical protein